MKRLIPFLLIVALLLCGCALSRQHDPFQVDTVIRIPVDPTEEATEPEIEETLPAPTEKATEPKETTPKKNSSSNGSSSGSKKPSTNKKEDDATEPPVATFPPVIETDPPPEEPEEPPYDPGDYEPGALEYGILDEMNLCRAEAGESELTIDGTLSGIAYLRAVEAAGSWSHTRPDGRSYTSALSDFGYSYAEAAELMVYASGSGNAENMVSKWMSSASHGVKILSGSFFEIGIGVYDENGVTYVVCLLVG